MAKNINHLQHLKSSVVIETNGVKSPKLPAPSALVEGEIAINYAKGYETLSIKNSSGEVVSFSSDDIILSKMPVDQVIDGGTSASTNAVSTNAVYDFVTAYTPTITVDQEITPQTSASTNPVATKVVAEMESVMAASINDLNDNKLNVSVFSAYSGSVDTALGNKVDKVAGKGLSTNDFTTTLKDKLDGIESGAEVNVQANWTETATTADSYIQNKPTLGTAAAKGVSNGITNSDNLIEAKHIYSGVGVTIEYDSNTQYINLKSTSGNVLSSFNASGFVVDGMIETVSAGTSGDTTVLDIKWNSAAGDKETILDIGDIFEADNYFTKQQLSGTTDYVTVTKANSANTASTVALTGVTGADDLKAIEALAGTSGYLKKTAANTWTLDNNTYSSATEISEALGTGFTVSSVTEVFEENERVWSIALATLDEDKTDVSAFTAHTASTNVHLNSTEKTNLDSLATNIAAISDISASNVTSWDGKADKTYVDDKLGSGFTGANSGNTVTSVIEQNEFAVSQSLNNLNSAITGHTSDTSIHNQVSVSGTTLYIL